MKKNKLMSYLALGIVFALFNVIAFVIPADKTATFWTAYVFVVVAFLLQLLVWKVAFGKKDTLKSKFLGIPVIYVGATYLIVQLIVFAIFIFVLLVMLVYSIAEDLHSIAIDVRNIRAANDLEVEKPKDSKLFGVGFYLIWVACSIALCVVAHFSGLV